MLEKSDLICLAQALKPSSPDRQLLMQEVDKLIDLDNPSLINRAQALGVTLSPREIAKLAPIALDYGVQNDYCERVKFALQIVVGNSSPNARVEGTQNGSETSLWQRVSAEIQARSDFYGSTFTPNSQGRIPSELVPGKDQPKMPQYQVWH